MAGNDHTMTVTGGTVARSSIFKHRRLKRGLDIYLKVPHVQEVLRLEGRATASVWTLSAHLGKDTEQGAVLLTYAMVWR